MLIHGNSFRIPLKDNSVNCVISSFPYWGLRSYGLPPLVFGGQSDCRHVWKEDVIRNGGGGERDYGSHDGGVGRGPSPKLPGYALCQLCGAFYGSFGLEPTMDLHIQNAVLVCREIKRVLHPSAVFWLNYGDSYATSRNGRSAADGKATGKDDRTFRDKPFSTADELPAKNLCMIPQRVAIALQADGWILRAAPPWVKRNPMPESVQDRPGNGHEYIYMLVKSERYFFDMQAVRKEYSAIGTPRPFAHNGNADRNDTGRIYEANNQGGRALRTSDFFFDSLDSYINHLTYIRDNGGLLLDSEGMPEAFIVNPMPYKYAHYATFPPALVAPMVKSSTSEKGVCPKCGAAWIRVSKPTAEYAVVKESMLGETHRQREVEAVMGKQAGWGKDKARVTAALVTTGWQPTCKCIQNRTPNFGMTGGELLELADEIAKELAPIPALILDPFCGSGTVGQVARELGRRFIGIDLSARYLAENALPRSEKKMSQSALGQLPLFAAPGEGE